MTSRLLTTLALSALLAACGGKETTNTGGGDSTGNTGDTANTPATGDANPGAQDNTGNADANQPETPPAKTGDDTTKPEGPELPKPDYVKPEDQEPETQEPETQNPETQKPEGGEGEGEEEKDKPIAGPGIKEPPAVGDRALDEIVAFIRESDMDVTEAGWRLKVPKPPEVELDDEKTYVWMLETDQGNLEVQLLHKVAPKHVVSTMYLSTMGFYDGLGFHRIVKNFMAQGGDPLGDGSGGPSYKYEGEIVSTIQHTGRGVLSMANAGPGTDGSQFFLTFRDQIGLNGKHTVFGRVISGWATVDKLEKMADPTGRDTPPEVVPIIKKARVVLREGS